MPPVRVLIVDDEPVVTNALSSLFTQAGFEIAVAGTGPEALSQLSWKPDLVILDVRLPEVDGFEVCRRIRHSPHYLPIVMLTAKDEPSDRVAGLELGADVYLTKPFEPNALLAQVRALLRLAEGNAAPANDRPLSCGPLRLWAAQHRMELNGVEVGLTPKEFELLRVFMRRPGCVFGRETMLREVWGYDFDGGTRTVDVHVQRLRAKIEPDPGQPQYLRTVRGFGYRLVTPDA